MIILVNSKVTASSIQSSLGKPEYSYYFLLKLYRPALEQIGQIIEVGSIAEVDPLFQQYSAAGEQVIFLSISPPQQTPTHLQCPTVCLFAWEFPNVPNEAFDNEPRNDWKFVFERIAGAIACSQETAQAVRNLMGEDYPVIALPAPVWPHFQHLCPAQGWLPLQPQRALEFSGNVVDSLDFVFSADGLVQHWARPEPFVPTTVKATTTPTSFSISKTLFKQWLQDISRSPEAVNAANNYQQTVAAISAFFNKYLEQAAHALNPLPHLRKIWSKIRVILSRAKNALLHPSKVVRKLRTILSRAKNAFLHPSKVVRKLKTILKRNQIAANPTVNDSASNDSTSITETPSVTAAPAATLPIRTINLSGVVFCSMFNPVDGRKNWDTLVTAFCWAFRDNTNATLVLKMTHHDLESFRITLLTLLSRLAPFQCRVIALHGYLDDQQYQQLISLTDFYVNASSSEGLCLPLMEFLSAGKPVLAPIHTAMLDYLKTDFTHVIESSVEPCNFYHDPTGLQQTFRHRIHWQSLMEGYRHCHDLAVLNPKNYQNQSLQASNALKSFADLPAVAAPLNAFFSSLSSANSNRGTV